MPQSTANLNSVYEQLSMVPLSQAAKMLGVCYLTAWQWSRKGRFSGQAKDLNGRIYIPAETVAAMLEARQARAGRPMGGKKGAGND